MARKTQEQKAIDELRDDMRECRFDGENWECITDIRSEQIEESKDIELLNYLAALKSVIKELDRIVGYEND